MFRQRWLARLLKARRFTLSQPPPHPTPPEAPHAVQRDAKTSASVVLTLADARRRRCVRPRRLAAMHSSLGVGWHADPDACTIMCCCNGAAGCLLAASFAGQQLRARASSGVASRAHAYACHTRINAGAGQNRAFAPRENPNAPWSEEFLNPPSTPMDNGSMVSPLPFTDCRKRAGGNTPRVPSPGHGAQALHRARG